MKTKKIRLEVRVDSLRAGRIYIEQPRGPLFDTIPALVLREFVDTIGEDPELIITIERKDDGTTELEGDSEG